MQKSRIILIAVPLIILLVALVQGNILVWRLFAISVFLIGLSFLWVYLGKRGLSGHLKNTGQHYQAGHPFNIQATIENSSALPRPFVRLKIETRLPVLNNNILINIPPRGSYYWQSLVAQPRRGRYQLGPLVAEITDPFGFISLPHKLDDQEDILVYPRMVDLSSFVAGSISSSGAGENNWFNRGNSNAIFGIREYVPGDSLNRIHWRSTAHTGQLIVKEFDSDQSKKVWVVLDLYRGVQSGKGQESTEEYAVTIAASVLKKYAEAGCHIGLVAQPDEYQLFHARPGYPHLWRLQEALAVFKATGQVPLNLVIERARSHFDSTSVVVIITPASGSEIANSISGMFKKGIPVTLVWLDASSFGGKSPAQEDLMKIQALSIPRFTVKQGEDISAVLNHQGKSLALKGREGAA